jgi:hypothetical protein
LSQIEGGTGRVVYISYDLFTTSGTVSLFIRDGGLSVIDSASTSTQVSGGWVMIWDSENDKWRYVDMN